MISWLAKAAAGSAMGDRVADNATVVSALAAGISIASTLAILQIVAALVAIAAGTMAFIYHFTNWKQSK